jgi:hypothetical protein
MMRHPLTWFALGIGATWAYHHFVKPLPGASTP